MNLVFAGTPDFAKTQLEALYEAGFSIKAVYTQPDRPQGRGLKLTPSPVKQFALSKGIPVEQPLSFKDPDVIAQLKHYQPDVLVVAAYGLLLPKAVLDMPRYGCINSHLSLLPRWRGAAPVQYALLAGDPTTGITLMHMNEGLDTGDILWQSEIPISPEDTSESLLNKLSTLSAQILKDHFAAVIKHPHSVPQKNSEATLAPKIKKDAGVLKWTEDAFVLDKKIRAFNPWPVAQCSHQGLTLKIFKGIPLVLIHKKKPGEILEATPEGITIACQTNALRLLELQYPGKKRMTVQDILNAKSQDFKPGMILC